MGAQYIRRKQLSPFRLVFWVELGPRSWYIVGSGGPGLKRGADLWVQRHTSWAWYGALDSGPDVKSWVDVWRRNWWWGAQHIRWGQPSPIRLVFWVELDPKALVCCGLRWTWTWGAPAHGYNEPGRIPLRTLTQFFNQVDTTEWRWVKTKWAYV
jgi:hypothetical protein